MLNKLSKKRYDYQKIYNQKNRDKINLQRRTKRKLDKKYRERMNKKSRQWSHKNKDKLRIYYKKYKDKANFRRRERRKLDPIFREKCYKTTREWVLKNKDKVRQYYQNPAWKTKNNRNRREKRKFDLVYRNKLNKTKMDRYYRIKNDPSYPDSLVSIRKRYHEDPEFRARHHMYDKNYDIKHHEKRLAYNRRPDVRARMNARQKQRIHTDPEYKKYIYSFNKTPEALARRTLQSRMKYKTDQTYRMKQILARRRYVENRKRTSVILKNLGLMWSLTSQEK